METALSDRVWITEEFQPPGKWDQQPKFVCEIPENEVARRNRRARALREYQLAREKALALGLEV